MKKRFKKYGLKIIAGLLVSFSLMSPSYALAFKMPSLPKLPKNPVLKNVVKIGEIAVAVVAVQSLMRFFNRRPAKVKPVKGKELGNMTLQTVQKWAQAGDMRAQFVVGYAYYTGQYLKKDPQEATKWWKMAAKQGHLEAKSDVTIATAPGKIKKQPMPQIFRQAGLEAYQGKYKKRDLTEAVKWWNIGTQFKDKKSMVLLGTAYFQGYDGVKKNEAKAVQLFKEGEKSRDPLACYELGRAYLYGRGVKKDLNMALAYLHEAAKQGINEAGVLAEKIQSNEIH